MIYLDNAATTFPKPAGVTEAVTDAMLHCGANPGRSAHKMSLAAARLVWDCREALAELFNISDPARIIFTLNCTDALNIAIQGSLCPGMHVITTALEHNSVLRQLAPLKRSGAIRLTILQPGSDGTVSPAQFTDALAPDTGLIICTHASNVTGVIQPVAATGALCREKGIRFIVDAAQTGGMLPIDVKKVNCDLLALPGHKGLYGPMGTGVLYVAPGVALRPFRQGGTGSSSQSVYQPPELPERLESGTLNLPGIAGLRAGVDFVSRHSLRIRQHEGSLMHALCDGLGRIPGISICGPSDPDRRVGVISFNIGDMPSTDVADALNNISPNEAECIAVRAGLHCAPLAHEHYGTLQQGAVRISPGAFNTIDDIRAALAAIESLATRQV